MERAWTHGNTIILAPFEAWSTPFAVAEPTRGWTREGVLLEGAGVEPHYNYVNRLYWPCGKQAIVIEITVQHAGLDITNAAAVLAEWRKFALSVVKAVTPGLPCAAACNDPHGTTAEGRIESGPWTARYDIVDRKGLVITELRAEGQPILEGVRVPHFKLTWPGGSRIVRFEEPKGIEQRGDTARFEWRKNDDTLSWCFQKRFDDGELKGTLTVYFDFIFRRSAETEPNCTHYWYTPRECYRFIPLLRFEWTGQRPAQLETFTPFYRFDYGQVGIAVTQDPNHFFLAPFGGGREWFVTEERQFPAARFNPRDPLVPDPGHYDNMHTALPVAEHNFVGVPVCRNWTFDCVHTHWRWGATSSPGLRVDPLVDPVTRERIPERLRGHLYLAPAQQIVVAIVLDKPGDPIDPDDPFTLVNGDELATTTHFDPDVGAYGRLRLESVKGKVVVWYAMTAHLAAFSNPSFFRHGYFVLRAGQSFAPKFLHAITMVDPGHAPVENEIPPEILALFTDDSYEILRPERGAEAFSILRDAVARRRTTAPAEAEAIAAEGFEVFAYLTRWAMIKALDAHQGAMIRDQPQPADPPPWHGPELPPGPARTLLEQAAAQLQAAQTMMVEDPNRFDEALLVLEQAWQAAVAAAPEQAPL